MVMKKRIWVWKDWEIEKGDRFKVSFLYYQIINFSMFEKKYQSPNLIVPAFVNNLWC